MRHTLRQNRERLGLTQAEAADRMGVSRSHYVKLERGERGLTALTIARAARAFDVPLAAILLDPEDLAGIPGLEPLMARTNATIERAFTGRSLYSPELSNVLALRNRLVPVPIVGKVEAGTFREVDGLSDPEDPELLFEEPDPDFPRARRMAFLVQGDSMNAAVPPLHEGYRLVCVDFAQTGVPLSDGMTVVVQRLRDGGLTREWSVKEVEMGEGEVLFCPRSTNPKHKPIRVPLDADPGDPSQVEVIGIARSVSAAIPRYRVRRP